MSPTIFSCIICGYVIWDYKDPSNETWLKQFRAICSGPTSIWVSGVGIYNEPRAGKWVVPLDYAMRWDDVKYPFAAQDELAVMRQRPTNDRHGFVFHEACWSLLQESYRPESIPLGRLLEICKSLPFPLRGDGVSWGHDYEGLLLFDHQSHYPWEDGIKDRDDEETACQIARQNPYDVPEVYRLLEQAPLSPPCPKDFCRLLSSSGRSDYFERLPSEICEAIATYLPTADFCNLRLASRDFVAIFSSQPFWASRFDADGDRPFVFEVRNTKGSRDWRSLYRCTNDAHIPFGLQNRKRVWKLVRTLAGVMRMWTDPLQVLPSSVRTQESFRWSEVAGDLRPEQSAGRYHDFEEGCHMFYKQCTYVPESLSQIAVSIIQLGNADYIAGIRLILSKGEDVCLGYKAASKEILLDVALLRGFVLATGPRGLRALQVITGEQCTSPWVGCPDESPRTRRLALQGVVAALEVGFDGFKIVSLGVAENIPSPFDMSRRMSLRDAAMWYPTIPESHLDLNEAHFTGQDPSVSGYQPLCWTLFGGPGGIYLRSLTGISVSRLGYLYGIEFHYNTDQIPAECRKLGRHISSEYEQVERFSIDGPGGEVIETVKVSLEYSHKEDVYNFLKHGKLRSFQVCTNRGQCFHFQPTQYSSDQRRLEPINTAPGTTITGFYGSQHPEMGLISLGVISDVICQG